MSSTISTPPKARPPVTKGRKWAAPAAPVFEADPNTSTASDRSTIATTPSTTTAASNQTTSTTRARSASVITPSSATIAPPAGRRLSAFLQERIDRFTPKKEEPIELIHQSPDYRHKQVPQPDSQPIVKRGSVRTTANVGRLSDQLLSPIVSTEQSPPHHIHSLQPSPNPQSSKVDQFDYIDPDVDLATSHFQTTPAQSGRISFGAMPSTDTKPTSRPTSSDFLFVDSPSQSVIVGDATTSGMNGQRGSLSRVSEGSDIGQIAPGSILAALNRPSFISSEEGDRLSVSQLETSRRESGMNTSYQSPKLNAYETVIPKITQSQLVSPPTSTAITTQSQMTSPPATTATTSSRVAPSLATATTPDAFSPSTYFNDRSAPLGSLSHSKSRPTFNSPEFITEKAVVIDPFVSPITQATVLRAPTPGASRFTSPMVENTKTQISSSTSKTQTTSRIPTTASGLSSSQISKTSIPTIKPSTTPSSISRTLPPPVFGGANSPSPIKPYQPTKQQPPILTTSAIISPVSPPRPSHTPLTPPRSPFRPTPASVAKSMTSTQRSQASSPTRTRSTTITITKEQSHASSNGSTTLSSSARGIGRVAPLSPTRTPLAASRLLSSTESATRTTSDHDRRRKDGNPSLVQVIRQEITHGQFGYSLLIEISPRLQFIHRFILFEVDSSAIDVPQLKSLATDYLTHQYPSHPSALNFTQLNQHQPSQWTLACILGHINDPQTLSGLVASWTSESWMTNFLTLVAPACCRRVLNPPHSPTPYHYPSVRFIEERPANWHKQLTS